MGQASHLRYPLDRLFSRPSHVGILRALQDNQEGMSGRAIAREARINHQVCALALRHLESLGLLVRQGTGRTQLIRLNFENYFLKELILPLLKKERELLVQIRRDIAATFKEKAVTITIFGSVARQQDIPGSDMDVLIISDAPRKRNILDKAHRYSVDFRKKYGLRLSLMVMTLNEARRKAKSSEPLLKNIVTDGIDLLPRKLHEVLQ